MTNDNRRANYINELTQRIDQRSAELKDVLERVRVLNDSIAFNTMRRDEARLIDDIKNGKIVLLHADTLQPVKVAFFQ